ncbi:GTP pyrophosphokinase [Clostridium grantii]|uniref:Putative GTP pyrophosphokinase n=1 Tax=Clostridium grantii DSM 8605 TaxID=1121316 RepID=A0A1M5UVB0_9CLOT|nr:GTP pyrophosphokinase family protein [Clostridium grantii]SHH66884.1 putative GTP pyrophosphokinase [Clostridium grantii DSM 8605]
MQTREWKRILIPYQQAVEELKVKFKSIRREYRKRNDISPIEFVTGRVKEISSILEKAKKFDIPLNRIEYELEDIAGIRIMCQFVNDIYKVVEIIRNRKDMQIMYEKDYIFNVKESGYRSYHMIIKYPVYTAFGEQYILAELQIRTLAMNFWATIEHSLNYKYKQGIPVEIQSRLKAAADAAFTLDQLVLDIKDEIMDAQKLFEVKSSLVTDITNHILTLISLGRMKEATGFQSDLEAIISDGDILELATLKEKIENAVVLYRGKAFN